MLALEWNREPLDKSDKRARQSVFLQKDPGRDTAYVGGKVPFSPAIAAKHSIHFTAKEVV